jgi:hypothetical protein
LPPHDCQNLLLLPSSLLPSHNLPPIFHSSFKKKKKKSTLIHCFLAPWRYH